MSSINHDHIDTGLDQRINTLVRTGPNTHSRTDTQAPLIILAGIGLIAGFLDIFHSDQAAQLEIIADNQHFLDPVLVQQLDDFFPLGALLNRHQFVLTRHNGGYRLIKTGLETGITIGDDADQLLAIDNRHPGNIMLTGQIQYRADAWYQVRQ